MARCVHCHVHTGRAERRGLCDSCYVSPARSLYDAAGRRVADFPPPPRDDDHDDRWQAAKYAHGRRRA